MITRPWSLRLLANLPNFRCAHVCLILVDLRHDYLASGSGRLWIRFLTRRLLTFASVPHVDEVSAMTFAPVHVALLASSKTTPVWVAVLH